MKDYITISDIDFSMCGEHHGNYRAGGMVRVDSMARAGSALTSSIVVYKFKFMRGKSVPMECFEPDVINQTAVHIEKKALINASIKRVAA